MLAWIYLKRGLDISAIKYANRALCIDPERLIAQIVKIKCDANSTVDTKIIKLMTKFKSIDQHEKIFESIGRLYESQNDFDNAIRNYKSAHLSHS